MRIVFTVAGLLAVLFIVSRLSTQQLQAVAPAGGNAASAAAVGAAQVQDAMARAAAARASDAAGE